MKIITLSIQASSDDTKSSSSNIRNTVTVFETYETVFVFTQWSNSIKFNCIQCIAFILTIFLLFFYSHIRLIFSFVHANFHSSSWISYSKDLVASCTYWIVSVMAQDRLFLKCYIFIWRRTWRAHYPTGHRIKSEMRIRFYNSNPEHVLKETQRQTNWIIWKVDVDRFADCVCMCIRWTYENHVNCMHLLDEWILQ